MQLIKTILLPLLFLGMLNPLKSQNSDLHQGAKVGIGVAAVAGVAVLAGDWLMKTTSSGEVTIDTLNKKQSLVKMLKGSRTAGVIAVSSGIIGYALLERGQLPGALVFGGVSLTSSVVAILKKRQWENTVSQRLDALNRK
jgi:hypothetical protein